MTHLPTRLKKEPLVEALFEVRFASLVPAISSVLPGLLFSKLSMPSGGPPKFERLPGADLPSQMRSANPILKYQPLMKVQIDRFNVLIGDYAVTVACQLPYPGWKAFRSQILQVIAILTELSIFEEIERYSLKYVDIIEGGSIEEQLKRTTLSLSFGSHRLSSEVFSIRIELPRDGFVHIVQIASSAIAPLPNGGLRSGLLIDVDTVMIGKPAAFSSFTETLPHDLDTIHKSNKELFFDCLTEETINYLEPLYEPVTS
jgi:uncharacterized protein (TIGR04255 family)